MQHILLLPNRDKDPDYRVTLRAAELLHRKNAVLYAESIHTPLENQYGIRLFDADRFPSEIEAAIVFGGDGSILDASSIALAHKIPLLGVNMGRLGYLADLEVEKLPLLERLLTDEYTVRTIHTFRVTIGGKRLRRYAVNEVAVTRGNRMHIADIELSVDGGRIAYRADGLVLATPTGSTAYSLSAGGAVIDPALDLVTVTPICPHSFFSRSLVFSGTAPLSVSNTNDRGEQLLVTIDGRYGRILPAGSTLTVEKSKKQLKIIHLTNRSFIQVLKEKMSL